MESFDIRWENFRGFEDTGWLTIRPLTVIIGANASGKTSILAPLLMMKQTLESSDEALALRTKGELFNAGSFRDLIYRHDVRRKLTLSVRRGAVRPKGSLKQLWHYPPGVLEIAFSKDTSDSAAPVLSEYTVRDLYGRMLLRRRRRESGRYTVEGLQMTSFSREFQKIVRRTPPEHFLFDAQPIFTDMILATEKRARRAAAARTRKTRKKLSFNSHELKYCGALTYAASLIDEILSNVAFLGPLREHPKRLYEVLGHKPGTIGTKGEYAPEILYRNRKPALMRNVNEWVKRFEFGYDLECRRVTEGAFTMTLRRTTKSPKVNLADTGFGLSQVLPLIVQCLFCEKGTLTVTEQPELHLNPRLQTILADLCSEVVSNDSAVLIETHSEHFVLRLRRLIAEKRIKAKDVALYFTERDRDRLAVREIPVEEDGNIAADSWPKGFFEDSLEEAFGLAFAQDRGGLKCLET